MEFWHYLALHLGMPVSLLQESITYCEFVSWQEYFNRTQFGHVRDDIRAGVMTANLLQVHTKRSLKVTDYILSFKRKLETNWKAIAAQAKAYCKVKGKVNEPRNSGSKSGRTN